MKLWLFLVLILPLQSGAVYEIGDTVPNMCWKNVQEIQFCLEHAKNQVRVLLYGAGWCPGCNEEMNGVVPVSKEFENEPVTFISLSAAGWEKNSPPDTKFLKEWQTTHHIPFVVAASPKDFGGQFFEPRIYIPNVAIIDKNDKLQFKGVDPGARKIASTVRSLIN